MEVIFNVIQTTLESFDFAYCIVVNLLTYFIIKYINHKNGNRNLTTWSKRKVLAITILSTGVLYYYIGSDIRVLLNSAIITPVFWSWILKPICKRFGIDYNQINIFK